MRYSILISIILGLISSSILSEEFRIQLEVEDSSINYVFEIEFLAGDGDREVGRKINFNSKDFNTQSIPIEKYFRVRQMGEYSSWGFWTKMYETKNYIREPVPDKIKVISSTPQSQTSEDIFKEVVIDGRKLQFLNSKSILIQSDTNSTKSSNTYYRINYQAWLELKDRSLNFEKDGEYQLDYYSIDLLGNREPVQSVIFLVDNESPVTSFELGSSYTSPSGEKFVSAITNLILIPSDSVSGIENTFYRINCGYEKNKPFQLYSEPIPYHTIKNQCTERANIEYFSTDRIGNIENTKIIHFQYESR